MRPPQSPEQHAAQYSAYPSVKTGTQKHARTPASELSKKGMRTVRAYTRYKVRQSERICSQTASDWQT